MDLTALKIPESKIHQLQRSKIESVEDLLFRLPRKYVDYTDTTGLLPDHLSVMKFQAVKLENVRFQKRPRVTIFGYDLDTGLNVGVIFWNQTWTFDKFRSNIPGRFILVGIPKITPYRSGTYFVNTPQVFVSCDSQESTIQPIYPAVKGMSADYYASCVSKALNVVAIEEENLPAEIVKHYDFISHREMLHQIHFPQSRVLLHQAEERKLYEDLSYFAMRMEIGRSYLTANSPYSIVSSEVMREIIKTLPYELTTDQQRTLDEVVEKMRQGQRVNAIIQGDVGCGKTIVSLLLMALCAENGYQSCLMAPTQILADQHYNDAIKLLEPYNIRVAFVSGKKMRKAEKQALQDRIESGYYSVVIGTQALLTDCYQFHKLALVIEDEEHKYGVLQRKALAEKAKEGAHTVTMSATPIPRSLAQTIFGDTVQLHSIHTMPPGRKPVITAKRSDTRRLEEFLCAECKRGRQAYIVCPLVSHSENEKMANVMSAEMCYEHYKEILSKNGISVALVTGKTKKEEGQRILDAFGHGDISVLVSTTVVEVGVNCPNATLMIIHNAERFGLASLHQLRGRVGRGKLQSYCVLVSQERESKRLQAMCRYSDGFSIAEMDLKLRGAGDILGLEQSGTEKLLSLALSHSQKYDEVRYYIRQMLASGGDCPMLTTAIEDQNNNIGGEMIATKSIVY